MDARETVSLVAGEGIVGDANHRGRRQVTLISEEAWRAVAEELGPTVDPVMRRANVLVRGVDLEQSRGRVLRLGSARLEIHGEVRPCRQMEETHAGLQKALDPHWRGGVFATVLEGGEVAVGDAVAWE
jgi:MOSC domain-containing protein YiiM